MPVGDVPAGAGLLVVKRGPNAGSRFMLGAGIRPRSGAIPTATSSSTTSPSRGATPRSISTAATFTVDDVGSLNGTYLNRERIEEAELHSGDELQIGKFRLVFLHRGAGRLSAWPSGRTCRSARSSRCSARSSPTSPSPRSASSRARASSTPSARRRDTASSTSTTSSGCAGSSASSVSTSCPLKVIKGRARPSEDGGREPRDAGRPSWLPIDLRAARHLDPAAADASPRRSAPHRDRSPRLWRHTGAGAARSTTPRSVAGRTCPAQAGRRSRPAPPSAGAAHRAAVAARRRASGPSTSTPRRPRRRPPPAPSARRRGRATDPTPSADTTPPRSWPAAARVHGRRADRGAAASSASDRRRGRAWAGPRTSTATALAVARIGARLRRPRGRGPPPAGLAQRGRPRGRPVRAAGHAPAAPAQPAGPPARPRTPSTS